MGYIWPDLSLFGPVPGGVEALICPIMSCLETIFGQIRPLLRRFKAFLGLFDHHSRDSPLRIGYGNWNAYKVIGDICDECCRKIDLFRVQTHESLVSH